MAWEINLLSRSFAPAFRCRFVSSSSYSTDRHNLSPKDDEARASSVREEVEEEVARACRRRTRQSSEQ